jgi:hypothetical protein
METMYDRIKRMDKHELAEFIYVVYQVGVKDGKQNLCDSPMGFFGCCYFLNDNVKVWMPNDKPKDFCDAWNI